MANYNFLEARANLARTVAEEGIVLLKNENNMLPFKDEPVAVFGRTQIDTIKCGTGSAFCESEYMVDVLTGLENAGIAVDRELADMYRAWAQENVITTLDVWGTGAHCNAEMPMVKDTVKQAATRAQKAIVVIGRTAGENDDVIVTEGDYLLSNDEKKLIERACRYFAEVAIVINSGNLIDLSFTEHEKIKAVVLLNLPGMEGGNALGNVLSGKVTPSGKLTDTIAKSYEDYPSSSYFGQKSGIAQHYHEDIFVGYRYFETFEHAKDRVLYP
ncbi:MAG: glycoside hydrolase family 3 C-terminal domain-containing protein, partial [Clostridia bacterium]|nr:glycoside hydrolase family 3 C-terminal domain-containing protein [Clostridia bacterium]